jgi:ABC-type branched-subunit amino acid transport system ATPase component
MIRSSGLGSWNHIYADGINTLFPQLEGMRTKRGHGLSGGIREVLTSADSNWN